ncbi:hypothetical protein K458DRAFT_353080 [Lentithecium fluviatile CBS 122367]|uniref:DUF676 domain-containing protein n=1 Tax=Lentithecium fluviatile CBS 122367 TaxID=1168545 RepID=A0A6G1IBU7_9PLEO|nr:hypothetical protein K458DRAFT_353080 [Lentithecium fluviatile CBS 122367]
MTSSARSRQIFPFLSTHVNMEPPKVRETGLTVLFDKTSPDVKNVDIVFVHGLNGNPKDTWTHENGFFWPWELRNVLTKARVMTFGYNASMDSDLTQNFVRIKGIAASLNGALANRRITAEQLSRPVIFVAHSLGGLVSKAAAVAASKTEASGANDIDKLYASMRGFMFFGTPHAGSGVFSKLRVKILQKMAKAAFKEIPPKLESALQAGSDEVLDLSEDFRKISLYVDLKLVIASYYEQKATLGLGDRVVDEFSAAIAYAKANDLMPINADHINMVKFKDEEDGEYDDVKGLLLRWETRLTEQGQHV